MAKELYTTNEAGDALGVTAGRVRQMILSGELEAQKIGRDLLITASAIAAAKNRKTLPGPTAKKKTKK